MVAEASIFNMRLNRVAALKEIRVREVAVPRRNRVAALKEIRVREVVSDPLAEQRILGPRSIVSA